MVGINGQYRHVTIPAENFSEDVMKSGIGFDASNYGYAVVEKSDMVFIPDTALIAPFCAIPTLAMTGNAMIIGNPDATCNPYFCYAAILMAGLDGIKNQIDPHENGWGPYDMNLYTLPEELIVG